MILGTAQKILDSELLDTSFAHHGKILLPGTQKISWSENMLPRKHAWLIATLVKQQCPGPNFTTLL